ncbi:HAD-IA family hydrolase [Sphingomonadales bacterium 56]|uniref:HAD-IA family hydrolase n=1 Tax=unclassified Sphingobium TaxID=2611147 RepID=UPI0019186E56|nr:MULTISPECIES: HAD-IA family hydrolase [unclassified Sphingobium]MBY2930513.1 HAD-IA family hydrolase [Sphingomonadales bacterium 56]MBY2960688.1 HAD-IA family hydrolase [Sphingomonadales bacterium 58]CAD7341459.1 D-inositol-3-phosphate glycosyltransferase [Sphingobium sp. S6]CAD7341756.1 D-inositol-3-phosphate glycosyltransferase [Sphingobium sp. S8]
MEKIGAIGDFYDHAHNSRYISFDLFDTLIRRKFLAVNEVHDLVSAYALTLMGLRSRYRPQDVTMLRYRMATALKGRTDIEIQEPTIEMVWDHWLAHHQMMGDEKARRDMVRRIVHFEHSIEMANLALVEGAKELLERLRGEKRTLIVISDMYFEMTDMEAILKKLQILHLFDHIYVSADANLTKQRGDLFSKVIRDLKINPDDMLHVGDNLACDIEMAAQLGIRAVHVEQHPLLRLARPDYGMRNNIEEDISDIVKTHIFSVLFNAHNRRDDHIYFMARDGLAISSFFEEWKSPLRDNFLPSPGHSDMYLNRVLTIWANVDFSVDWLPHAVGIAFWLKEGTATASEISHLLGIEECPQELGEHPLTSINDTFRVANAYREAGLEDKIKSSIIKKRLDIERYLEGLDFYNYKSVAISDLGYSGTVSRALNSFLVQRCAEGGSFVPPMMFLHLIATYHNFEVNRPYALPFCEMSDEVLFPIEKLPDSLSGSYAWLEYFFKHPTLLPILNFVEGGNGGLSPQLCEAAQPEFEFPSEKLLRYATHADQDIVLMWMAATNNFNFLVDPLIERFSQPDADTLSQMREQIYELDPIAGTTRSPILEVENALPEAVAEVARKKDYWIAGSVAASQLLAASRNGLREEARHNNAPTKRSWIQRLRNNATVAIMWRGFEADFYRGFYPDLRVFKTDADLWKHYDNHGREERRLPSRAAFLARLEAECGTIPDDFDHSIYLRLNPDIAHVADTPERALDHFVRIGRSEGRKYRYVLDDIRQDFEQLCASGIVIFDSSEQRRVDKGEGVVDVFLSRYGIRSGPWIFDIDVAEFRGLYRHWAGDVSTAAEVIVALCEKGLDFAPSFSLKSTFDPKFYRSQITERQDLSDAELFRHYLNVGSQKGAAPSEQAWLLRIWGHEEFPTAFDWVAWHRTQKGHLKGSSRCEILEAFIASPGISKATFVKGEGAPQFLEYLATHSWLNRHDLSEARFFMRAAMTAGGNRGWLEHMLGDIEDQAGNSEQALIHYRNGVSSPTPNRWSYLKAANLMLMQRHYSAALTCLESGRHVWQEAAPWRQYYDRAMHMRSNNCVSRIVARPGSAKELDIADRLISDISSRIPEGAKFNGDAIGVLIFTGRPLYRGRDFSKHRHIALRSLQELDSLDYLGTMLQSQEVVFHEVPFTYEVARAILTARALGKRTILWLGDLRHWNDYDLDQSIWGENGEQSEFRRSSLWEMALVARYCDEAVTTVGGCLNALSVVAPNTPRQFLRYQPMNIRGDQKQRKVVMILPNQGMGSEDQKALAKAIAEVAKSNKNLDFVVDDQLILCRELKEIQPRLLKIDNDPSISVLSETIPTIDLVVQSVSFDKPEPYAAWIDAEAGEVPFLVVQQDKGSKVLPTRSAECYDHKVRLVEGDLSAAMIAALEDNDKICQGAVPPPVLISDNARSVVLTERSKSKILFVNVWFAPQLIGGATRVMKDNVDYFIDNHRDEFEISIFCTDESNDDCGQFSVDTYRGVPVFRIATPQEENIYWRPENAMAAARFAEVLDSFKPDLVHIHCLQRLGATIADVCGSRDIPYLITMHDAWWLSDFFFLSDNLGLPVSVHQDYFAQSRLKNVGVLNSARRAQQLREALLGARRRLAVSQSFQRIYDQCGIPCDVLENGVSRILQKERHAESGPVAMCHIGGLERHKGAYLIEAALKAHPFANLELTIVDLARAPGHDTHTFWGQTRVTITGRMSSEDLASLYARSNILLAPSTCEESFGLVTREALAHGLWVVASDRGAMAEPVVPGENGFVVSVNDISDIVSVFMAIDRDHIRYKKSPAKLPAMRTADDQSRDLVDIYRKVINDMENIKTISQASTIR